ncbi:MAG: type VI secretion system contractile sheath large subunit [Nannocystaceae bacterium]
METLEAKPVNIEEFEQSSMLQELFRGARIGPTDGATYAIVHQGLSVLARHAADHSEDCVRIDVPMVDRVIAEIDQRISAQVNEILHAPAFQAIESAWRGLKFLVDRVDFRENIEVEVANLSKAALQEDFEESPERTKSGLYRMVYSSEFGTHGGKPYGLIVANYQFGPGAQDLELLADCGAVAAMAHAPMISNVGPEMFGARSFVEVPRLRDIRSLLDGPQYARWRSLRDSEDARYLGLCMPRFLLRQPYDEVERPSRTFVFNEDTMGHHDRYLWGHASLAFASRVAESFARYRWCPNIIGPKSGGEVQGLPLHHYKALGELQTKVSTEVLISERREFELSEEGFISLVFRKGADNACFFSANSVQRPKVFARDADGAAAETNFRLGTQLPYMFIVTRLAHYLKVLQREQLGSWKERSDLERELNRWLSQYVADMESPAPGVRSRKPLRQATVGVEDVPGQPGWYRCNLKVRPHFKYMGASFTLSLVGKLDREA